MAELCVCRRGMAELLSEWVNFWGQSIYYMIYEQSEDTTCEDYTRGDGSTGRAVTSEIEDVTALTPLQKVCKSDGEAFVLPTFTVFQSNTTVWCSRDFYSCIIIFNTDVKTDSSTRSKGLANIGVIAGIAAALLLLLALILVALYINYHPSAVSPLYLTQVSIKNLSNQRDTVLYVHIEHIHLTVLDVFQRRKNYWPSFKFQKQQPGYTEVEGDGHEKDSIVEAGPCWICEWKHG